jgi:Tfp pilus assembly protein PilX
MAAARTASLARRLRRCQRGFVLPLTLGISTVFAIVGTTAIAYTTSGARTASRSTADQKAYALAEAGVNNAMAVLSLPSNNALDPYLLPATTVAYDDGTVTYSGTLDLSSGTTRASRSPGRRPRSTMTKGARRPRTRRGGTTAC